MAELGDEALNLDQLLELAFASAGEAIASPFHKRPYLLLELDTGSPGIAEHADLIGWLNNQPCPVIGVTRKGRDSTLLDACDLVLESTTDLDTVIANIRRAPLAAMTLVQVLRITSNLSLAQALSVESLAYATLQAGPEFASWLRANPPVAFDSGSDIGPTIIVERYDERLDITLNRPGSRNAISVEMRDALVEAMQLVLADASLRCVRFAGAGACFSTGGDLREFGTAANPASAHAVRSMRLPAAALIHCAERAEFQLHSACIGAGIELAAFAGRVSAARNTFFQLPEIRFGLIPGAGGCVSLPRRIGRQRTAYMVLSGRRISAATALKWGLIDELLD